MNIILEVTMIKQKQVQLGVIFKQDKHVIIESVAPHSCASRSGLKPGDIVLAVENKAVSSVPQVAKFIRGVTSTTLTLRVQRLTESYTIRKKRCEKVDVPKSAQNNSDENDTTLSEENNFIIVENVKENFDVSKKPKVIDNVDKSPKTLSTNENVSKFAQTIGSFSLRKRKASVSDKSISELSSKSTPNSSNPSTPQHTTLKHHSMTSTSKRQSILEVPEIIKTSLEGSDSESNNAIEVGRSKDLIATSVVCFNDEFQFSLKKGMKYLNINVWGRMKDEKDVLLGYVNIPLSHVLNECFSSVLGHYMRRYSFLPPACTHSNR